MQAEYIDHIDLAYAAGFLEADGCIQIPSTVKIANKNLKIMSWLKEVFGGTIDSKTTPVDCYEWQLHGLSAEEFLLKIKPFLKFKNKQLEIFMEYRETINPRGRKVTDEVLQKRKRLIENLKKEKRNYEM